MSLIPGAQINITGASGSQGLLAPRQSWRAYVFPRGGYAAAGSAGTLLTFDSASIASRFAVNNWLQVGTDPANLRKVSAVGGNSLSVAGNPVTVAQNDRVFLVGNTQPTVTGGSATYVTPATTVYDRNETGSNLQTNSMLTSNSDGLIRFYAPAGFYDVLIQDGNQSAQGYVADLGVGMIEAVSTSDVSVFGATVTVNATLGVTGSFIGDTVTVNKALGVTGWATFGSTATFNASAGFTGTLVVGQTLTAAGITDSGSLDAKGWARFGASVTIAGALGVTGSGTFGSTVTGLNAILRRAIFTQGTALPLTPAGVSLSATWGATATFTQIGGMTATDTRGAILVTAGGAGIGASPTVSINYQDGSFSPAAVVGAFRCKVGGFGTGQPGVQLVADIYASGPIITFWGTPVSGEQYGIGWIALG